MSYKYDDAYRLEHSPGDTVSIGFAGVLRHYGVVTSRGTVISNSRKHGGVIEQSLNEFSKGQRILNHGRDSNHPDYVIEKRARRHLGRDYDLTGSNCIDLVHRSNRRKPTPWQVGKGAAITIGDMVFGRKRRR